MLTGLFPGSLNTPCSTRPEPRSHIAFHWRSSQKKMKTSLAAESHCCMSRVALEISRAQFVGLKLHDVRRLSISLKRNALKLDNPRIITSLSDATLQANVRYPTSMASRQGGYCAETACLTSTMQPSGHQRHFAQRAIALTGEAGQSTVNWPQEQKCVSRNAFFLAQASEGRLLTSRC